MTPLLKLSGSREGERMWGVPLAAQLDGLYCCMGARLVDQKDNEKR